MGVMSIFCLSGRRSKEEKEFAQRWGLKHLYVDEMGFVLDQLITKFYPH